MSAPTSPTHESPVLLPEPWISELAKLGLTHVTRHAVRGDNNCAPGSLAVAIYHTPHRHPDLLIPIADVTDNENPCEPANSPAVLELTRQIRERVRMEVDSWTTASYARYVPRTLIDHTMSLSRDQQTAASKKQSLLSFLGTDRTPLNPDFFYAASQTFGIGIGLLRHDLRYGRLSGNTLTSIRPDVRTL